MAPYHYEPLPEPQPGNHCFRLLDILPSPNKSDPLKLTLQVVRLEDRPEYKCLSYAWGRAPPDQTISIVTSNSTDSESLDLPIRPSLHDALLALRQQTHKRTLWADAICINQSDISERSNQVSIMGIIYWSAFHVAIWLGPDPDGLAERAFGAMQPISAAHWSYNNSILRYTHEDVSGMDPAPWEAVAALYKNPWFRRAWVQQELGLSREAAFIWGSHHPVDIRDLFGFDIWMEHVGDPLRARFFEGIVSPVRGTRNLWLQYGQVTRPGWLPDQEAVERHLSENPFLVVLLDGSACQATDPRDHVYAFLGHPAARRRMAGTSEKEMGYREGLDHTGDTLVVTDYNKSVEEVYMEVAEKLILQHGDLRMLGAVCHTAESIVEKGCPSWVPRWDIIQGEIDIGCSTWGWPNKIESVDGGSPVRVISRTLCVKGLITTTITEVWDWTDELLRETKARIMNRERTISVHTEMVVRRRVFRTQGGQEGLVQDVVRAGDQVALLVGAYTPVVLRRVKGGDYVFVGTCILFGVSDGRLRGTVRDNHQLLRDILIV